MCNRKILSGYWVSGYAIAKRMRASTSWIGDTATSFEFTKRPNYSDALIAENRMYVPMPIGTAFSVRKVRVSSNIPENVQGMGIIGSDAYGETHCAGKIHSWTNGGNLAVGSGTITDPAFNIPSINILSDSGPLFDHSLDFIGKDFSLDCDYRTNRFYGSKGGEVVVSGAIMAVPELSVVPHILLQISLFVETYDDETFDKIAKGC